MNTQINRRNLIKRGFLTLGGLAAAPHLMAGAFGNLPLQVDSKNRLVYSPMLREHLSISKEPVKSKSIAKLNANENPYGPPKSAAKAVVDSVNGGSRYAWRELYTLIDGIAKKEGLTGENIMMGPGSSDLLEKVAIVLFQNGGNVVSADPCYMSLVRVAQATGATWKAVPCKDDWSHDLKAMEAAIDDETKLVYICNPNNPTGAVTSGKELMDFCSRVSERVPIFVDEAYLELVEGDVTESMVSLVAKNKNVIVARTFSKIMGMAGLRIGYIAATTDFLAIIQKITRGGMGISLTSVHAAIAAIEDTEFQAMTKKLNTEAKEYVYGELKKMGYTYIPSYTNFLIFPISMDGKEFLEKMSGQGVMVRAFDIQDKTWCRVSLGTMDEMKMFTSALSSISS